MGGGAVYAEDVNNLTLRDAVNFFLSKDTRLDVEQNLKTPSPTLQMALVYNKDKMIDTINQRSDALKLAADNFKQARDTYINSFNASATQNMISKLQTLTSHVQTNLISGASNTYNANLNTFNQINNDLKDAANSLNNHVNDYQNNLNDFKKKLDSVYYWGSGPQNWGITYNGTNYGWDNSDKFGDAIRDNEMYKNGQNNIKALKIDRSAIYDNANKIYGAANALASATKNLGTNDATQNAINQINTIANNLKNSISGSSSDAESELDKADLDVIQAFEEFVAAYQSMIALEQMKQQATQTLAKEQQSLSNLASNFSSNMTKVNFASSLATDSRLAKLSNPYSQDTEFAAYIEEIKNKSLAANTVKTKDKSVASDFTSSLASSVYAYDLLRFKKNNNLWGNVGTIIGNSNSVNSVSGVFSFGYDAWVKNMILGAYGSYAYTTDGIANVASSNKSHNADIGFYSRFFLGQNEIDLNLGESFGFNFLSFKEDLLNTTLKSDYVSFQTHLDLTYGYVFKIGKGWFSKPFIGINYNYGYNLGMDAKATDISMGFDPFQTHFGAIRAGLELRKYFNDNQSYFYIAPAFYQGVLFENTQTIQTRIYESNFAQNTTSLSPNQSLDTSFLIKAGGEWQAGDNIFINISVGAKLGNLSQYGMLNLGGRWVF